MRIPEAIFREMINHAGRELPLECCGLLAGREGVVTRVYPLENQEKSPVSYLAAPEQEFHALTEIEGLGLDLLAVYHSHPETESYPSQLDIEKAYFTEALYFIISLKDPVPRARAFRISRGGAVAEVRFEIF